jgi:hypothetical protein
MRNLTATRQEFARARRLHRRGIPLDPFELERMRNACLGLQIFANVNHPSLAFSLPEERAGYLLNAVLSNDSNRPIVPAHIVFEGPDGDSKIQLLPDPQKKNPRAWLPRRQNRSSHRRHVAEKITYQFADGMERYDRDAILNHRSSPRYAVYPGELVEGVYLAVGENPIPRSYNDRDHFRIRLTLFDKTGRSCSGHFDVMVCRSPREIERMQRISQLEKRILEKRPAANEADVAVISEVRSENERDTVSVTV